MRILLLIDRLDVGGAETHVTDLARALLARGHDVWVLSEGGTLERRLEGTGVRALHFPVPVRTLSFGFCFPRLRAYLKELHREHAFDVVHAHTRRCAFLVRAALCQSHDALPALLSPAALRAPYRPSACARITRPVRVVTVHARYAHRFRPLSYFGDATVAVSQDLLDRTVHAFGVSPARIRVIPNGIDPSVFYPPRQKRDAGRLDIVFASRLDADCSAAVLALLRILPRLHRQAAARGLALSLTVLGGGRLLPTVTRAARQAERAIGIPTVRLLGAVEAPADLFRAAHVFVGVSRAALEAAFCGCCVVLAGNEGFGGLLREESLEAHAKQNFCCRGLPSVTDDALESALVGVMSLSLEQREALAQSVRDRLSGYCDAASMAEQTERLYEQALSKHRRLGVLVGGYAGCGNLGDDAILRALVARWEGKQAGSVLPTATRPSPDRLRRLDPPVRLSLCALTAQPHASMQVFGIPCAERKKSPLTLLAAAREADAFVLGGGALLQNGSTHGRRSLFYYLALLWVMRLCGCPFYLVANGVGPVRGRLARAAIRQTLRYAQGITVRDNASLRLLVSMGLTAERIAIEPDPVRATVACPAEHAHTLACHILPADVPLCRAVCVVPRQGEHGSLTRLALALRLLWKSKGLYPLFFAFDAKDDRAICEELRRRVGVGTLVGTRPEQEVAGLFGGSAGVISMRLHGLILAAVGGVRALGVSYDERDAKLSSFAQAEGQTVLAPDACARDVLHFFDG